MLHVHIETIDGIVPTVPGYILETATRFLNYNGLFCTDCARTLAVALQETMCGFITQETK
jgi:hypothetical protein